MRVNSKCAAVPHVIACWTAWQVLPRKFTDARTYNMLVSVCVKARDLTQALHAADMLRSTGRKLDTILYTNLIGGARHCCSAQSSLAPSMLFLC